MSNLREIVDAWLTMRDILHKEDVIQYLTPDTAGELHVRLMEMIPKIVREIDVSIGSMPMVNPEPRPVDKAVVVFPENETNGSTPAPGEITVQDRSYEEFAVLFEDNDRPVADSFRVWFEKDYGGWDKTTAEDRAAVWEKATAYFSRPRPSRAAAAPQGQRGGWQESRGGGGRGRGRENAVCSDCGGTETTVYVSNSEKNKGRSYNGCVNDRKFFSWVN